jgi:hypothetical protein
MSWEVHSQLSSFTALGVGELAAFHFVPRPLLMYVSTSHASVHRQSVCVIFLGITQKFKSVLRAVLKIWSRYDSLIVSFELHLFHTCLLLTAWQAVTCIGLGSGVVADILIAVSMCWFLYHKRTGFTRRVHLSPLTLYIWLSFVHRTDSMIMTLMSYSLNSGLLTR